MHDPIDPYEHPHMPQAGWEDCPGVGLPMTAVSRRWSRCTGCGWVGFRTTEANRAPYHRRVTQMADA